MAGQERERLERRPNPENASVRLANPAELMQGNPAALIVNTESYDRMAGRFSPAQFEPPQVVKVATYSSGQRRSVQDFVLDGMTRTKFVSDNKDAISLGYPEFNFRIKDVTQDVLQNPAMVPPEEKADEQEALTMLQYLRAVIPPTVEHSQIAPDRIAAHLINGWDNMVGEEVAEKYSALAALSLLANPSINIATDQGLKKDLENQSRLMGDETSAENSQQQRKQLEGGLVEMAQVIRETKLLRHEVAQSAYMLVSAGSDVIGGEKEALKQVYGLLYTPAVEQKLADAFPDMWERQQTRGEMGQFILNSFKRAGETPNKETTINVLSDALRDTNLEYSHVVDIFTSKNPVRRYDSIRTQVNRERLTRNYTSAQDVDSVNDLNPTEWQLIENLGAKTILKDPDIRELTRRIKSADSVVQGAEELKSQIAEQREQLLAEGVDAQLLDEAVPQIVEIQQSLISANSLHKLSRKNRELESFLDETTASMTVQITGHRVGEVLDEVTGDKLKNGYGPQIRTDIVGLVTEEFNEFTEENQTQVRERIHQLASIDSELLLQVKRGEVEVSEALKSQEERNKRKVPERAELNTLLGNTYERLESIPVTAEDLTDAERENINLVVRYLGNLAYGHPDTPRVMKESYPNVQKELKQTREELVYVKREEREKDARTGK